MNILITILLVLESIIALLLITALFMKKKHYVKLEKENEVLRSSIDKDGKYSF